MKVCRMCSTTKLSHSHFNTEKEFSELLFHQGAIWSLMEGAGQCSKDDFYQNLVQCCHPNLKRRVQSSNPFTGRCVVAPSLQAEAKFRPRDNSPESLNVVRRRRRRLLSHLGSGPRGRRHVGQRRRARVQRLRVRRRLLLLLWGLLLLLLLLL